MTPFATAVSTWSNFYMMLGGASAGLTGLLFVSLSINIQQIKQANRIQINLFVSQTFFYFLFVLLFSAIFLIPDQTPSGLGSPLLIAGVVGFLNTIRQIVQDVRTPTGNRRPKMVLLLPVITFVALIVVAIAILTGDATAVRWMVIVMLILISLATANAYRLLVDLSEI